MQLILVRSSRLSQSAPRHLLESRQPVNHSARHWSITCSTGRRELPARRSLLMTKPERIYESAAKTLSIKIGCVG